MRKYLTELIGSFFLALALGLTGNPLASGLLIVAIVYFGGHISGAHYNPGVTLAFWATNELSFKNLLWYTASQFTGSLAGCILIYFLAGSAFQVIPASAATPVQYSTAEILFSFLLCMVYLTLFLVEFFKKNRVYGLVIGLSYAGILMVGEPITGGVFNPALATAVSIVDYFNYGESYLYLPAYIFAPAVGAILAGNLFSFMLRKDSGSQKAM